MHFPNTLALMKDLQDEKSISLEQVMSMIETLFSDVQYQTGELVENCRIDDMRQLIITMSAVTNDIVFIFRNNEASIMGSQDKYCSALTKAQSACADCQDSLNNLKNQIESMKEEEVRLQQQLKEAENLRRSADELEGQLQSLRGKTADLQASNPHSTAGKLRQQVAEQEAVLTRLIGEYEQVQQHCTDLETQIKARKAALQDAQNRTPSLKTGLAEVTDQLNALIGTQEALSRDTDAARKKLAEIRTQYQADTYKLAQINKVIETNNADLQKQKDSIDQATADLQKKTTDLDNSKSTLTALQTTLSAKEKELETQQQEYNNLTARLKHAQDYLTKTQEDAANTRTAIGKAEQELSAEKSIADQHLRDLLEITTALEAQKEDNIAFRRDHLDKAQEQFEELKKQIAADRQKYDDLLKELDQKKLDRKTTASQNGLLEVKIQQVQKLLSEEQDKYDKNKAEVDNLEAKIREKADEMKELFDTQDRLRGLLNGRDTEQIRQELEANNRKLEEDIRQANALESEIRKLQGELDTATQRLEQTRTKLNDHRKQEQELRDDYNSVAAELDEATSEQNRARSEQLENQLALMKGLAAKLTAGNNLVCGEKFQLNKQVCDSLDSAEQTIRSLRQVICEYANCRQSALEGSY